MPTRNVVPTDHQAHLVDTLASTGRHEHASEVLGERLRLIEAREAHEACDDARLHAVRQAACNGVDDCDAGHVRTFESPADLGRHPNRAAGEAVGARRTARSKQARECRHDGGAWRPRRTCSKSCAGRWNGSATRGRSAIRNRFRLR
ncbi:MAG: type II toxin-antitoxin system ParD family antitoxin [Pseudomonadota bacterium]